MKDINAEEAIRDWRGKRQITLKRLIHAVETDNIDEREVQNELDEYGEDEDLSEDELVHRGELSLQRDRITYEPPVLSNIRTRC